MKRLLLGVVAAALATATAASAFAAARNHAPSAPAACSKSTAKQVVNQHDLNHFAVPNPAHQVLCGPFTGPGSQAMAVAIQAPTCWPVQHWAVFTLSGGSWRLVHEQPAYLHPPLVRVGSGIRETTAVRRPGDSRCNPSGGKRSRIWRWNGSSLVAGPWKQVERGTPTHTTKSGFFKTPSANIVCYYSNGPVDLPRWFLGCGIKSGLQPPPPRRPCEEGGYAGDRVEMNATGTVGVPACAGDPGALVGESQAKVLGYGKTWSGGGIRCTSAITGLTCRNKSGHGFFLSRERWRRF